MIVARDPITLNLIGTYLRSLVTPKEKNQKIIIDFAATNLINKRPYLGCAQ